MASDASVRESTTSEAASLATTTLIEYPLKRCGRDYSQHTLRGGAKD
jgi:hypothetical protein